MHGDCRGAALDNVGGQAEIAGPQGVGQPGRDAAGAVIAALPRHRQQSGLVEVQLPLSLKNEDLELLAQFAGPPQGMNREEGPRRASADDNDPCPVRKCDGSFRHIFPFAVSPEPSRAHTANYTARG